jgi:hypothetical protein
MRSYILGKMRLTSMFCLCATYTTSRGLGAEQTGFDSLRAAVHNLDMVPCLHARLTMKYQTSSIGYLSHGLGRNLLEAARNGPIEKPLSDASSRLYVTYPSRATALRAENSRCNSDIHGKMPACGTPGWLILRHSLHDLAEPKILSHKKLIRVN